MSLKNSYWGGRGNCPFCGLFVGNITGYLSPMGLEKVTGVCKYHGEVDISFQDWNWDDFDTGEEDFFEQITPPAQKE